MKFIRKESAVEAIQCRDAHRMMGEDWKALPEWFRDAYEGKNPTVKTIIAINHPKKCIEIVGLDGVRTAFLEDWIVCGFLGERGIASEVDVCNAIAFSAIYEPVTSQ